MVGLAMDHLLTIGKSSCIAAPLRAGFANTCHRLDLLGVVGEFYAITLRVGDVGIAFLRDMESPGLVNSF